jgi:hypothetical protein
MGRVRTDGACGRERHHQPSRQVLHAQSVIPARRGGAGRTIHRVQAPMRQEFPEALYHRRAWFESFLRRQVHAVGPRPGRSLVTPCLRALLRGVAYNVYRLYFRVHIALLRMSTEPNRLYLTSSTASAQRGRLVPPKLVPESGARSSCIQLRPGVELS